MKKIITLLALSLVLLSFGCKKDADKTAPKDNQTDNQTKVEKPKTDMEPFKKSLSVLTGLQHDLLYKLIEEGGINAQLENDVTISYPTTSKRLLNEDPQITIQKGATPLGIAALFCTPSLVNDLIEKGADVKAKTNGMEISAIIIQCGEAEQAGMFENYMKAARKVEKDNPDIYKNKSELYAANAIIYEIADNGELIPTQTIMNYATQNKLNDAIPVIIKYAGGINFYKNDERNPDNQLPIVTALKNQNYEAARLFFEKTGSLFAEMYTTDGVKVSLIDYLFYNVMDAQIREAEIPVNTFFKSLVNGYKQTATGIPEIKQVIESGRLTAAIDSPFATEDGEAPYTTIAHIAAAMEYNALLKGIAFYHYNTNILNMNDENGDTPLHIAIRHGNFSTARVLLEAGVDIDQKNDAGLTPLAVAIKEYNGNNQAALVRLLLTSASNTIYNYDLMLDEETLAQARNIKGVNKALNKYNIVENGVEVRGYLLFQAKHFANEYLNPQVVRILQGGLNNQLKFAAQMYETNPFPQGATPLIAAAIACSADVARYLVLAKADTDIRITGENELKYDAYDFADRVAMCEEVKTLLKNPSSVKIDMQEYNEWKAQVDKEEAELEVRLQELIDSQSINNKSTETVIDENTTMEESPADDTAADESEADVELVIEE